MSKHAIVLFVLMGVLIISTAGYLGFSTNQPPQPTPTPETIVVTTCEVEQTVTAPGNLVNVNQAEVHMPATGRLAAVNVRVGDPVRKGQILAELDPITTTQAQLDLLEAQGELDKLQRRRTSLDYPRATDDFIKDLRRQVKAAKESVNDLDDAAKKANDPTLRSQLLAALANAKENLRTLESRLSWYTSNPTESEIIAAELEKLALPTPDAATLQRARQLFAWGVSAVFTDRPDALLAA